MNEVKIRMIETIARGMIKGSSAYWDRAYERDSEGNIDFNTMNKETFAEAKNSVRIFMTYFQSKTGYAFNLDGVHRMANYGVKTTERVQLGTDEYGTEYYAWQDLACAIALYGARGIDNYSINKYDRARALFYPHFNDEKFKKELEGVNLNNG